MPPSRSRFALVGLAVATTALGLATRRFPGAFPAAVAEFGGDALYAVLMYWLAGIVRPIAAPSRLFLWALSISVCVEFSQLLQWRWLQALRSTWLGAHVLGQGFVWTDLVCYAAGASIAFALDSAIRRWEKKSRTRYPPRC